ncbi:hypothetical protein ACMTAU_21890, partial [Alcaligenes pakistanensis]
MIEVSGTEHTNLLETLV